MNSCLLSIIISTILICATLLSSTVVAEENIQWKNCEATFDGKKISVSNSLIKRCWNLGDGGLHALELTDLKNGVEWISKQNAPNSTANWTVKFNTGKNKVVEAESLQVKLICTTTGDSYQIRIFNQVNGIELERMSNKPIVNDATIDSLNLKQPSQLEFTNVTLKDNTDHNKGELVTRETFQFSNPFSVKTNIAYIEDKKLGHGIIFFKLAPLPHARAQKITQDFTWDKTTLSWFGPGVNTISGRGYPCVIISYSGGKPGRIAATQDFQRALRQYVPKRDGQMLSNTWGDRSKDAKISESFLKKEIEAGKKLGIDVMQIDDGWQKGLTKNSAVARSKAGVWSGFWKSDPQFWTPHRQRLPNGLKPITQKAKETGLNTGLWYAPDSDEDFSNWKRDAERILELHRANKVNYFKLDSIVMTTALAEDRVNKLMNKVIADSNGKVIIDLDVTAGIRPGYLGAVSVGTVFVENRYTDFKNYWPHKTLRNFWDLSEFIDPVRLRMEFLNQFRNKKKYKKNPLAPATYSSDYLFASIMFSSPLAWFEVSELPEEFVSKAAPLIKVWKVHRSKVHGGHIIPIGKAPNGKNWTGFCSISKDRKSGYAVILKEINPQDKQLLDIPLLDKSTEKVTKLYGKGSATIKDGKLSVNLPDDRSYIFVQFGD